MVFESGPSLYKGICEIGELNRNWNFFLGDDRVLARCIRDVFCDVLCSSRVYKRFKVDLAHTFSLHAWSII